MKCKKGKKRFLPLCGKGVHEAKEMISHDKQTVCTKKEFWNEKHVWEFDNCVYGKI